MKILINHNLNPSSRKQKLIFFGIGEPPMSKETIEKSKTIEGEANQKKKAKKEAQIKINAEARNTSTKVERIGIDPCSGDTFIYLQTLPDEKK